MRKIGGKKAGYLLPNNTHGRPHQGLAAVGITGNGIEQLKDRLHVRLKDLGCKKSRVRIKKDVQEGLIVEQNSLLELIFMAPIMPPQASMIPSRRDTT